MNLIADALSRLLRAALKLVLLLAAAVFIVSFLLAALVFVAGVSLWSLLTGRKPAPVVMFSRMREQSQRYTQGVWPGQVPKGDVVDVDASVVDEQGRSEPLQRLR
jgi:hypothetical protein